jgi:hypothetical protein
MDHLSINYDGKMFQPIGAATTAGADVSTGYYHQDGETVWANFGGGEVVRGYLVGRCAPDGSLDLAYCQVLADASVISGKLRSTPEILDDGRIRLHEEWERFSPTHEKGVSIIEEHRPQ